MTQLIVDAILVGILLAIPLSLMSYFVVMRRMTFSGVGIAHSAFGGIALGFFLGVNNFLFPIVFCMFIAVFIAYFYRRWGFSEDSIIDVTFVFSMAFGIFLLSLAKGYSGNILGLLFGDILSVTRTDLIYSIFVSLAAMFFLGYYFDHLNLITYNEDLARVNGVNVNLLYYAFWLVLSLLIVFSIKLIGIILVNAFLVLPTLVGLNLSKNYRGVIIIGTLASILSIVVGVLFSFLLNTPTGATIVLAFFALWLLSFLGKV